VDPPAPVPAARGDQRSEPSSAGAPFRGDGPCIPGTEGEQRTWDLASPALGTTEGVPGDVRVTVDPNREAPRRARALLTDLLVESDQETSASRAAVVVSELVTNAVVHARPPVEIRACVTGSALHVEVTDQSSSPPRTIRRHNHDPGGLGLSLVDALADRWGYEMGPGNVKTVWFEIDSP
jgi:anti-sigma regulatory factor (Ser/Thr protein kinase)